MGYIAMSVIYSSCMPVTFFGGVLEYRYNIPPRFRGDTRLYSCEKILKICGPLSYETQHEYARASIAFAGSI